MVLHPDLLRHRHHRRLGTESEWLELMKKAIKRHHSPAFTVKASTNCSFHDDVPIRRDAFALCTNLSTVFCWQEMKKLIKFNSIEQERSVMKNSNQWLATRLKITRHEEDLTTEQQCTIMMMMMVMTVAAYTFRLYDSNICIDELHSLMQFAITFLYKLCFYSTHSLSK